MKALVTVELQLCSDFLFPLSCPYRVQHKIHCLLRSGLVGNDAVIIQIPDDGKIQYTLPGMDIRNIRRPLPVRSVGMKILFPEILVFMQMFTVFAESSSPDHGQ